MKISSLLISIALSSASFEINLQAQNYEWANAIGNTAGDIGLGRSIAVDNNGNTYLIGRFNDTADFDPSAGTANLIAAGQIDIFFAKYDANGNYLWAKSIGAQWWDDGRSIAVDAGGNVYITGTFSGTADFDPGTGTVNLTPGSGDIFFAKYDTDGNYLWAKNIGGTGWDVGRCITVGASGNIYITGQFVGTADFDPGTGTANLTSAGQNDIFIAKYDTGGNYLWANRIGSTSEEDAYCIAVDAVENVCISGNFNGTVDFNPGSGTANLTVIPGGYDCFFAKYDANGNYLWANSIGSSSSDTGMNITFDINGNVYLSGYFNGTADFDPGAGTANLTDYGIFFAKYDQNGNYLWAKNIGAGGVGNSITVDSGGNVYLTAYFNNTADFDTGIGTFNLTSAGGRDIFFAKYDENGDFIWVGSIGTINNDRGNSIEVDNSGNIYIIGNFSGTADFDSGTGTSILTAIGQDEIFFARYSQAPAEADPVFLENSRCLVYPDPSGEVLFVSITGQNGAILTISDILGRNISDSKINQNQFYVTMNLFKPGIYFYMVLDEKGQKIHYGKFFLNRY